MSALHAGLGLCSQICMFLTDAEYQNSVSEIALAHRRPKPVPFLASPFLASGLLALSGPPGLTIIDLPRKFKRKSVWMSATKIQQPVYKVYEVGGRPTARELRVQTSLSHARDNILADTAVTLTARLSSAPDHHS